MAQINIGRILPIFKGNWVSTTKYTKLDVVYYNGSSYVALADNTNTTPRNSMPWQLVAKNATWAELNPSEKAEALSKIEDLLDDRLSNIEGAIQTIGHGVETLDTELEKLDDRIILAVTGDSTSNGVPNIPFKASNNRLEVYGAGGVKTYTSTAGGKNVLVIDGSGVSGGGSAPVVKTAEWVELFDHTTENDERYFTFTTLPDGTPLNASEIIYVIECGKANNTGITYNGYFDLYNEANDKTQMYINAFQHTAEGNICNGHIFASPYTFPISYQATSKATIAVTTQLLINQGTNVNFRGYVKRIEVRPNHNFASASHIKIIVKQEP